MIRRAVIALVVAQGLYTTWAWACSCGEPDIDAIAASESTLVVATVDRVRITGQLGCQRSSAAPTSVTVTVEEDLRGVLDSGASYTFETVAEGASCGLGDTLTEGARWLFHAESDDFLSLCSLSHELPATGDSDTLAELREAMASE